MYVERHVVPVTTDSSGNATAYTPIVTGKIQSIVYVKDGSAGFSNGVDFTITVDETGENVWTESDVNASAVRAPRQPTHSQAGAAALYAAAGAAVNDHIAVARTRIKIVIAQGGNAKTGTFHVVIA